MGREELGPTPGVGVEGGKGDCHPLRGIGNAGSFNQNRANLDAGAATRYVRKHPEPSVGDRFGSLQVLSLERGSGGGIRRVEVLCDCWHIGFVVEANLRTGKTTRCNTCAKKATVAYIKNFWGYADVCPDDAHRRRLLNRIAACIQRCSNPKDAAYANYGGRGIRVHPAWITDRKEFLRYLLTLPGWDVPVLELDRIRVNDGYEPGNLRFITKRENINNRRTVQELQARIADLESRLRLAECWAPSPVLGQE